jgi:hypothetical protein
MVTKLVGYKVMESKGSNLPEQLANTKPKIIDLHCKQHYCEVQIK